LKNKLKRASVLLLLFFIITDGFAQNYFEFSNKAKKQTTSFQLLSNL